MLYYLAECTLFLLLPHRGSNSQPNPYVGHAASQLVVALPALAQTALKPKQVAVVRVKENRCYLLTGEKEQIYNEVRTRINHPPNQHKWVVQAIKSEVVYFFFTHITFRNIVLYIYSIIFIYIYIFIHVHVCIYSLKWLYRWPGRANPKVRRFSGCSNS